MQTTRVGLWRARKAGNSVSLALPNTATSTFSFLNICAKRKEESGKSDESGKKEEEEEEETKRGMRMRRADI